MNINDLFKTASLKKASDLHLVTGKPPLLRIDGQLQEIKDQANLNARDIQSLVFSLLSKEKQNEFIQEKELDFSHETNHYRYRVNIHWEKGNIGLVARLIPDIIPNFNDLFFPPIIKTLCQEHQGLIIVTGPTGCGKSTTLAAMVDYINQEKICHIITLEDPIEFIHQSKKSIIRQREFSKDFHSFSSALKHIVRQDPNVILVGEMRDLETMAATITLAETGHLVLATLHTMGGAETIDRVIDVFPPYQQEQIRTQLSLSLRSVISQKLLSKTGGGRIAAREILINTPAIGNLIRENKIAQIKNVIQTSAKEGMISMDQCLNHLLEQNLITQETAQPYLS